MTAGATRERWSVCCRPFSGIQLPGFSSLELNSTSYPTSPLQCHISLSAYPQITSHNTTSRRQRARLPDACFGQPRSTHPRGDASAQSAHPFCRCESFVRICGYAWPGPSQAVRVIFPVHLEAPQQHHVPSYHHQHLTAHKTISISSMTKAVGHRVSVVCILFLRLGGSCRSWTGNHHQPAAGCQQFCSVPKVLAWPAPDHSRDSIPSPCLGPCPAREPRDPGLAGHDPHAMRALQHVGGCGYMRVTCSLEMQSLVDGARR